MAISLYTKQQYLSETWALEKTEYNVQERTDMRMLRWMMGTQTIENIMNEEITASAGVANNSEKI